MLKLIYKTLYFLDSNLKLDKRNFKGKKKLKVFFIFFNNKLAKILILFFSKFIFKVDTNRKNLIETLSWMFEYHKDDKDVGN